MRNQVRFYLSALFYYTGLVKLICWWLQHSGRHLIILYYHRAEGVNLRNQWVYLRRHYRILPLEAALEELQMPIRERAYKQDRRTLLALTFDDGYYDNYTHAFALASDLQVPITIFLITGYIGYANAFWWATHLIRLARVDQVSFEGHIYHLNRYEDCKALAQVIDDHYSNTKSVSEREQVLSSFCELLAVPSSAIPKEEPAPLLTWAQIREMEESEWASFGAHTIHHPDLQHMTHPVEIQHEVGECRIMLEQQLGHPVDTFVYPYGHVGNYGLYSVKQAGYKWAFTTLPGSNTCHSNPHLLQRISANADKHVLMMAAEIAGVWRIFSLLKRIAKLFFSPLALDKRRVEAQHRLVL